MKKTLVLSILGLAAAANSYGQGNIAFNTYYANSSNGIITTFGPAGTVGVNNTFTGVLLWSTVNIASSATVGSVVQGTSMTAGGWNIGSIGTFQSGTAPVAGFLAAADLNLTALQLGGVNQNLTLFFEVAAYSGASYAGTVGDFAGHSATFTATLVQGLTQTNPNQINNMAPFSVYSVTSAAPVPEPSTLALAGLGGFGMLMAMRRKKA